MFIPKTLRDAAGIAPGDEVAFSLIGTAIRIERVSPDTLMGRFAGHRVLNLLKEDRQANHGR